MDIEEDIDESRHWTIKENHLKPGKDKLMHYAVCLIIPVVFYLLGNSIGWAFLGFASAIVIGFLKELYDRYIKKTFFDWGDIVWDILGAFSGLLVSAVLYIL